MRRFSLQTKCLIIVSFIIIVVLSSLLTVRPGTQAKFSINRTASFRKVHYQPLAAAYKRQLIHHNCSNSSTLLPTNSSGKPLLTWPSVEKAALFKAANDTIHVATVCCGTHSDYLLAFVKSIMLFSFNSRIILYIIVEHISNVLPLRTYLNNLKTDIKIGLVYEVHEHSYSSSKTKKWKLKFQPCASQKLLLPYALAHVKRVISLDLDIIFLRPVEQIWKIFDSFSELHIAALVGEDEGVKMNGYDLWAQHPFPPPAGLNDGVMLMDLARIREMSWFCILSNIVDLYGNHMKYFDQDIINIFFFFHSYAFMPLSCGFNYRTDHCKRKQHCVDAIKNGVSVLHGNRKLFRKGNDSVFKRLHAIFLNEDITQNKAVLLQKMQRAVSSLPTSSCTKPDVYTIGLSRLVILHERKEKKF